MDPGVIDEKVVMEMWNGSDVPGATTQAACAETASVIDEVSDDHFNDLRGKPGGGGRARCRGLRRSTTP